MKKIFVILFMCGFIFTANAEINKVKVDGNKTYYSVVNKQINAVYVCEDNAGFYDVFEECVLFLGWPINAFPDNENLNPEVAVITKRHGNSQASFQNYYVLNTYSSETNTYQTFVWLQ